ncbi:unnamed protein product [Echinostoma caproni]|uniref:G_PROTEIN_RECEP_F1_2 domain-containing protein n=1 Tax=Echinostoma caproni TaxID=27848 RepID=A0A183AZV2_9TREM|nr:unnamed protein product [Echinostoma caproni]
MTATQATSANDPARSVTVPTCCAQFASQTDLAGSTQQSAALAAATNLPAVSAAAVAAVAAATAFAARTSTATFAHDVHSGRNQKVRYFVQFLVVFLLTVVPLFWNDFCLEPVSYLCLSDQFSSSIVRC